MKVTQQIFAFLSTVSLISAQLPSCAQSCLSSLPSQCGQTDINCICADSSFSQNIGCCSFSKCDTADFDSVISFAVNLCSGAGISIASTLPSCPSSTSGAPSAPSAIPTTGARTTSASPTTTPSVANSTDATTSLSAGAENQQLQSRLRAGGAIFAILVLNFL
ncbi:uncharacterized protein EAE97_002739 [Botrytis byssoidea]|uniref:CFEM domain-containing protein n=1 Tax=Botrytis byssoidea TaxID=139641 RepID=A0A9P5IRQ9_9HELO|nr:uncharacterized protein EAE97_002739 [Botrytis byssoidea]KAF7951188.1 hypothetical protein EAE97_002739 [Botrytis byssoidea]